MGTLKFIFSHEFLETRFLIYYHIPNVVGVLSKLDFSLFGQQDGFTSWQDMKYLIGLTDFEGIFQQQKWTITEFIESG